MKVTNDDRRRDALHRHIDRLSPNLLRAYVLDILDCAPPELVDKMVVAFHAQNAVPAKES